MRPPPLRLVAILLGVFLVADVVAIVIHDGGHKKVKTAAPATTTSSSTSSTTSTTVTAAAPAPTMPVPGELARQFDQIKAQVASLRGLDWVAPLDIRVA